MTEASRIEPQRLPAIRPGAELTVVEALRQVEALPVTDLLTRVGGEVQVSPEDRRMIAIYANGVALVSKPDRWSGRVKSILNLARNAGWAVSTVVEVETARIIEIYTRAHAEGQDAGRALTDGVTRQRQLAELLGQAARLGANDLQIRVLRLNTEIRVRIHGRMTDLDYRSPEDGASLIKAALAVAADQGSASSDLAFQQGALTPSSGLLPRGVELVRLQYSPTSENRSALVMRLKYRSDPKEIEIDSLGYAAHHIRDIAVMPALIAK